MYRLYTITLYHLKVLFRKYANFDDANIVKAKFQQLSALCVKVKVKLRYA